MIRCYNAILETNLRIWMKDHQTNWDQHILVVFVAYTSVCQQQAEHSMGFEPEFPLPVDLLSSRRAKSSSRIYQPAVETIRGRTQWSQEEDLTRERWSNTKHKVRVSKLVRRQKATSSSRIYQPSVETIRDRSQWSQEEDPTRERCSNAREDLRRYKS